MTKFYYCVEPAGEGPTGKDFNTIVKSEDDIVTEYGPWWISKMLEAGRVFDITRDALILDWVVVNWAVEIP